MIRRFLFVFLLIVSLATSAQRGASLTTDLSLIRSFSPGQGFFAIGQTIQGLLHFTPKESGYASFTYFSPGKYHNELTAVAKAGTTGPQTVSYRADSKLRFRNFSLGWRHYFKGDATYESNWNVYGTAGFGLITSVVENEWKPVPDTALYEVPQQSVAGTHDFNRLSLDLGIGTEIAIGGGIYLYADLRTWLPASSNPSPYLYTEKTPRVGILSAGLRILFD